MTVAKQMITGRLSYPHLTRLYLFGSKDQAATDADPKARYEATIILEPGQPKNAAYQEVVQRLLASSFGKRASAANSGIKDGNDRENVPEGFLDRQYLVAKSKVMPKFFGMNGKEMSSVDADKKFYAGCYVNMLVQPYTYDAAGNKGVAHELLGIQFAGDGESLTGRPSVSESDFSDVTAEAAAKAAAAMGA